jgi:glycosyltransferase involved in cell wall biosynthesis
MSNSKSLISVSDDSVALISVFPIHTGTTTVVSDYRDALTNMGYRVTVYQLVLPYNSKKYLDSTFKIEGKKFFLRNLELPFNSIFKLPKKIPDIKTDIVILTDPIMLRLKSKFRDSITIFYDMREFSKYNHNPLRKILYMYLLKFLQPNDKIIAISHFTEETVKSIAGKNLNVQVVEQCSRFSVDVKSVYERIKAIKIGKKRINILYLAADRPYKKISTFINVAKIINNSYSDANIHFILVSKLRNSSKRSVKRKMITNLEIIDEVDNLSNIYSRTDIFLFPSLIEGFGLPLIEAMSFGIPIIYSNKPPMRDIVGNYGIPVDPFNVDSWVKELLSLLDVDRYEKMALLSYERSKNYSFDKFKERLAEALKNFNLLK